MFNMGGCAQGWKIKEKETGIRYKALTENNLGRHWESWNELT